MFDEVNAVPKPNHNRRVAKRSKRTEFSEKTRRAIYERDNGLCVYCFKPATDIHHINFRSELTPDVSSKRNGACLCRQHHEDAHTYKWFREWLKEWKVTRLDGNGDYKEGW